MPDRIRETIPIQSDRQCENFPEPEWHYNVVRMPWLASRTHFARINSHLFSEKLRNFIEMESREEKLQDSRS
jgi:hypothetical protein